MSYVGARAWLGLGRVGARRPYRGLGAAYDNPTVTGVIQLMDFGGGYRQVRISTVGWNGALTGPADILDGLAEAVGRCVKVQGYNTPGGYYVEGWTLLTSDSALREGGLETTCAFMEDVSAGAGQVPTTTTPPTGGGTQPAPSAGQTPVSPPGYGGGGSGSDGYTPPAGTGNGAPSGNGAAPAPAMAGFGLTPMTALAGLALLFAFTRK